MPVAAISVLLISLCVFQQTLTLTEIRQTQNSNGENEISQVEDPVLITLSADNLTEDCIYLLNGVPHHGKKKIPQKDAVINVIDADLDDLQGEEASISSRSVSRTKRFARPEPNMYWMKGIVPYTFHPSITIAHRRDAFTTMSRFARYLCVTFVLWNTTTRTQYGLDHDGHIEFKSSDGCSSYVGNLKLKAGQHMSCCGKGSCMHELGHALGLYHEHQRFNRDGWVRVNWDDITYQKDAYAKIKTKVVSTIRDYDLSSPMHYWLQIEPGVPPVMTVLFQELTVTRENFYQFKELASMYQCKEQHCRDFNIECHNEGYVTKIDGKCSCRCVEGMDPATGCLTPLARSSTDPSQFPGGSYALLSSIDGCPRNTNMTTGSVTHFFESSSSQAPSMLQGWMSDGRARHYFCINSSPENGVQWPNGEYCLMRVGGSCPSGFEESSVQFDNTAQTGPLINGHRGNIPDGDYGNNTRFIFCCRDDGFSEDLMPLPSSYPFVLISTSSSGCQGVQGMTATHLKFNVQNSLEESIHGVTGSGPRPFIGQNNKGNFEFHYCYYNPSIMNCGGTIQLSESTRTATFTSPGYPGNYSNNLQCSWVIQSPEDSTIILNFSDFDIDGNINSCDDKLVIQHSRIGQRGLSYCGRGMEASIRSHFNYMHVRLLTSLFDGSRGFNATVTVALAQDLCYDLKDRGATYRGKVNFTRTFQPCLPWTRLTNCPHNGFTSEDFSDGLDENYCRNPDKSFSPWCYTEANLCKRDYCDVCMLEKPYDSADNCGEFKAAGSCSNQALARKRCSLTCADQLVPIEAPRRYTEIRCPPPPVPLYSVPTTQLAASYTLGQSVRFNCSTGKDTRVTTCLSDGSWTHVEYVCGGCPDGWYPYRQTCYQSFSISMDFNHASYFCGTYGGVIAETRDVNISDFLFKLRDDGASFWIGLRETSEGHWVWQDGTKVTQTNWNIPPADPKSLTCALHLSSYKWGDNNCNNKIYFNCQKKVYGRKLCVDRKPNCAAMVRAIPNVCQEQPDYAWEVCPLTCKVCQAQDHCYDLKDRGATYRGKVNFTRTFQPCLPWTSVTNCPHNAFTSEDFSDGLDENYCRNPDKSLSPWCYTEANLCKRDYCDLCTLDKEIRCPPPPVPLDSVPITQLAASYTLGQSVRFICSTGKESRVTTCLSDGSWTHVEYVCGDCPDGWYPYRQTCYQSFSISMEFFDASYFCGVYGGVIAETRDVNISDFLFKLRDDGASFWIGLRETSEGQWVWQDGTKVTQTNWNTPPADPKSLTCGMHLSSYKWGDNNCNNKIYFNCQLKVYGRKLCVDRKPNCAAMVRAIPNVCQEQPDYAWEVCPLTCKVCQACPCDWTEFKDRKGSLTESGNDVRCRCDKPEIVLA